MAEKYYTHFPKEFERNILQELDRRYWSIFFATLIISFSMTFYLKSIPYVPDLDKQKQMMKQLFKAQEVTTQIKVQDLEQLKERKEKQEAQEAKEEIAEKIETKQVERAKITNEERKAQRAQKSKARAEKGESLRKAVSQMSVFSAAGSRSGGGGGKGVGVGSGGGSGGRKFGGIGGDSRGIAGGGLSIGGGKKLVTGGKVEEVAGGIEIAEGGDVGDVTGGELGGGLEMEEIQEVKGEGAKNELRSTGTLNSIFKAQQGRITRCFERFKKRDPQLNGRMVASFTILPDGSVTRISIKSQWSNVTLGSQVDECIRERVEKWKFDAIDKGDVKIELPMSFY